MLENNGLLLSIFHEVAWPILVKQKLAGYNNQWLFFTFVSMNPSKYLSNVLINGGINK
jgi:hypothetical protein